MKKISFLLTTVVLVAISAISYGQQTASATASASATIITPISISKTVDLNFGNVAVGGTSGTVAITAAGVRSATGGVTLPATAGSPAAASFTVTGQGSYTYAITLPSTATTIDDGLSHTMTVGTFVSNPGTTGTLSSGTQTLTVGATLNVGANQTPGVYTSATPFTVTVQYN
jgi:hypothetical protein